MDQYSTEFETSKYNFWFGKYKFIIKNTNFWFYCLDWTQCIDKNTGHPYFWNISTKEVTWEMPSEYEEFLRRSALSKQPRQNKWLICYSDDGTKYFFNETTREISWEQPNEYVDSYTMQQTTNGKT